MGSIRSERDLLDNVRHAVAMQWARNNMQPSQIGQIEAFHNQLDADRHLLRSRFNSMEHFLRCFPTIFLDTGNGWIINITALTKEEIERIEEERNIWIIKNMQRNDLPLPRSGEPQYNRLNEKRRRNSSYQPDSEPRFDPPSPQNYNAQYSNNQELSCFQPHDLYNLSQNNLPPRRYPNSLQNKRATQFDQRNNGPNESYNGQYSVEGKRNRGTSPYSLKPPNYLRENERSRGIPPYSPSSSIPRHIEKRSGQRNNEIIESYNGQHSKEDKRNRSIPPYSPKPPSFATPPREKGKPKKSGRKNSEFNEFKNNQKLREDKRNRGPSPKKVTFVAREDTKLVWDED